MAAARAPYLRVVRPQATAAEAAAPPAAPATATACGRRRGCCGCAVERPLRSAAGLTLCARADSRESALAGWGERDPSGGKESQRAQAQPTAEPSRG
eukprot:175447-Chlamydomonas_euryale.AAC.3